MDGAAVSSPQYACVECGAPLPALTRCPSCDRVYAQEQGRPSAFPNRALTYSVALPATATDPGAIPRDAVFRFPAEHGQRGSGVYHFDRAHKAELETLAPGALILETGCGGAQLRDWATARGLGYVGTDVSLSRVHGHLQSYGGADLLCDAHALPLADASVDVVYASAVYEHLALPHVAASEAARVLKPCGLHLGSMSFMEPWHDESYAHMSPNGVYRMLASAGLVPRHIWPEIAWPGYYALLAMGNPATRALRILGKAMTAFYMAPARVKHGLRLRRWPSAQDLYDQHARIAGAIAWIAEKPSD
ncbi:MAG: class I SAM-dependent methyltransferase [Pseudomonadota bacterium]